jgi:hypothetical protein
MSANRLPRADVDPANDTAEQHSGGKNAYFLGRHLMLNQRGCFDLHWPKTW